MMQETTKWKNLDMADDRDRGVVRTMAEGRNAKKRARWSMDDDTRDQIMRALKVALRDALEKRDSRAINGISRTFVAIDRMNQIEELKHEEWARLDAGLLTGRTECAMTSAQVALVDFLSDPENDDIRKRMEATYLDP